MFAETAEEEEKIEFGEPDPVAEIKPQIALDAFSALDLRVCRILKCQEIRKARNNLKLTLFDGIHERTIVSSIKAFYKPEELEGRRIIVVVNLKPAQMCGILSNGMEQYLVFSNPMNKDMIEVLDLYVYNIGIGSDQISLSTVVGISKSLVRIVLVFTANGISKAVRGESII